MIAHAVLAVLANRARDGEREGLIALTCQEVRRLFGVLIVEPARTIACPMAWSTWRRRTSTAPRSATTSDEATHQQRHNDLQLEY